jgi:prenyl protein peptidase
MAVFQLAYTTLFGAHCAFVFLRGGSVWPTVTAHMWCNFMGIPQIADEVRRFANRKKCMYHNVRTKFGRLTKNQRST